MWFWAALFCGSILVIGIYNKLQYIFFGGVIGIGDGLVVYVLEKILNDNEINIDITTFDFEVFI